MASGKRKKSRIRISSQSSIKMDEAENGTPNEPTVSRKRRIGKILAMVFGAVLVVGLAVYLIWGTYLNYIITAKTGVQASNKKMHEQAEYLLADALRIGLGEYEKELRSSGQESARRLWERYQITATANRLGSTYLKLNKQAPLQRMYYEQVIPPLLKMYGEKSTRLVRSYGILAESMVILKDFSRAEILYREMITIVSQAYGPNDSRLADALNSYAHMLDEAGRKEEAKKFNGEARRIQAMQ